MTDKEDKEEEEEEEFDPYRPGTLWQTRKDVEAIVDDDQATPHKRCLVPFESFFILLEYWKDPVGEIVRVLWNQKIVFIVDCDVGHDFKYIDTKKKKKKKSKKSI